MKDKFALYDCAIIKGATNFEVMRCLPIDAFYVFTVYHEDTKQYTGFEADRGIFVRIPKGKIGFDEDLTLKDLYPKLKTK